MIHFSVVRLRKLYNLYEEKHLNMKVCTLSNWMDRESQIIEFC